MVNPPDPTRSTNPTGGTTSTASTQSSTQSPLDRDAFLKLLVAQMSHQDPLQPMEGTEFVAQLSQFAAVEQAVAQTHQLEQLSSQTSSLANNQAVSLVGKSVSLTGGGLS